MFGKKLLCAIALFGLVALSQADSNGGETPTEQFPSETMEAASEMLKMEEVDVKYCTKEVVEQRRKFCDKATEPEYRATCEKKFGELIELCYENMNEIVAKTFDSHLVAVLMNQFDTIEDIVARPLDETFRSNLEKYFGKDEIFWDLELSYTNPNKIANDCDLFVADYQAIKTIVKYSNHASLLSAKGDQAREAFEVFEFCRVFTRRYKPESQASGLYSDI